MTQDERILDYLNKNGSITPIEAFTELGCTKLATRISYMRKQGIEFDQEFVKGKNRFGENVKFMRYSLKEAENG